MKDETLIRLKETAKLEALIASKSQYDDILRQSQKLDRHITKEMIKINGKIKVMTN